MWCKFDVNLSLTISNEAAVKIKYLNPPKYIWNDNLILFFLCSLLLQRISQTKYLFAHNIHTLWLLAILVEWNRNIPEVQITFPLHDKVKFAIFPLSCVLFYTLCTNIIHVVSSCIPWCQLFYPHVSMHFISTRHDITVYRVWQCRHEI